MRTAWPITVCSARFVSCRPTVSPFLVPQAPIFCVLSLFCGLCSFLNPDSPGREEHPSRERPMEAVTPQLVCAKEALALLNCTVETPFDRDKCLRLLDALRSCVLEKKVKKFSVAEQSHAAVVPKSKEKP